MSAVTVPGDLADDPRLSHLAPYRRGPVVGFLVFLALRADSDGFVPESAAAPASGWMGWTGLVVECLNAGLIERAGERASEPVFRIVGLFGLGAPSGETTDERRDGVVLVTVGRHDRH